MIVYNVTVKVDNSIHEDWIHWMKAVHIPDVMATGIFTENRMLKVLVDDTDGVTYSIQYTCPTMADYERYRDHYATALQKLHLDRYQDKYVAFRTLLQVI